MSEGGKVAVQTDDQVVSASELRALKKQIRGLQRLLGKKAMEVEILKEAVEIAREKTDLAHVLALRGRFPIKRIAQALDVARSHLTQRPPRGQASDPHATQKLKTMSCCR